MNLNERGRFASIRPLNFLLFSLVIFFSACGGNTRNDGDRTTITVWFHTGRPAEQRVIKSQAARFNAGQDKIFIKLLLLPEGDYNTQVQAAAAEGSLPDLLDLDGPYLANYAWKGHLRPLDDLISDDIKKDLLPSIIQQGTYNGRLYALGTFDSGLGLYADRAKLLAARIRLPHGPGDAWTIDEFDRILAALADLDSDGRVLDLRLDYRGEWFTYAFAPVIRSAGGGLIDRTNYLSAQGVLNGPQTAAAAGHFRDWFRKGYIDPNTDTNSFVDGRVALSWCGHWEYPRYYKSLGDNLVLLPLPDFGTGTRTGMGSWCWAVTRNCRRPAEAARFIEFLLKTEEVLAMCRANGAIPATRKAVAVSSLYRQGGPLDLFVRQLQFAVPRPRTPAYPVITSAFQQAFQDIRFGVAVQKALDRAVRVIDQDIRDNQGYPELWEGKNGAQTR